MKRRYRVTFSTEITIDDKLFESVLTDEWRSVMYPFHSREQVAEHIAFNMVRGCDLSDIDGYADQPNDRAQCGELNCDDCDEVIARRRK